MELRPIKIPDGHVVVSLTLMPQAVRVNYGPLQPYLEEARGYARLPPEQLLRDVADLTVRTLGTDNYTDWEKYLKRALMSREPGIYSLDECIRMQANSCFHMGVFYALLMDSLQVDSWAVQGRVVETAVEKFPYPSHTAPLFNRYALGLNEGDFEVAHLWNITRFEKGHRLVDTAYLVDGEPVVLPIKWSMSPIDTFSMKLPDGRTRHYLMKGAAEVRQSDIRL